MSNEANKLIRCDMGDFIVWRVPHTSKGPEISLTLPHTFKAQTINKAHIIVRVPLGLNMAQAEALAAAITEAVEAGRTAEWEFEQEGDRCP